MAKRKKPVNIAHDLTYRKTTQGTYVFEERTAGSAVRVLYVRKDAMPDGPPDLVTLMLQSH